MLRYIIDGFNLVHKVPSLKKSLTPHRDLIQYIKKHKLTGSVNNRVMVVFDGAIDNDAIREREFEVIFGLGKSADTLIKERVHKLKNKSEVLVVSDDREIADYARREGAKPVKIADFIKIKEPKPRDEDNKEISYTLQAQITEELRKIWLKE